MSETIDNNHSNIGVDKLNSAIEAREKQLTDMVNMLADLNQQLNDVLNIILLFFIIFKNLKRHK